MKLTLDHTDERLIEPTENEGAAVMATLGKPPAPPADAWRTELKER